MGSKKLGFGVVGEMKPVVRLKKMGLAEPNAGKEQNGRGSASGR